MPCITTVTLNPALDEAVALETLTLGGKNRCSLDSLDPGGKGVNASRVIRRLGRATLALGFAGGLTGELLRNNLDSEGVPNAFVRVGESTRVNIMIYERGSGRRSRLYLPGPHVTEEALREIESRLSEVPQQSVVVLGGSVPPGVAPTVYRDLVHALNEGHVKCIVDTSGEALAAVLPAHPDLVKPNIEEASALLQRALLDDEDVLAAARELRELGAEQVVISQGAQGAVGVNAAGAWKAVPPRIVAYSTVGSGDSMVAGLAIAMDEGGSLVDGMRLGSAAGAATAMISGTQLCRAQDVHALLDRIDVHELLARV
ncbi:MAG TPA: 1-phosphofructokinase [Candidatus Baltobacteraceae bacterium]|nr:1-phosphofructokinase [Candidatus Baltobacteraceae bacterium]